MMEKKSKLLLAWVIFALLALAVFVVTFFYVRKRQDIITTARPLINTYFLPDAKAGQSYSAQIMASVTNANVKLKGEALSGLPDGLQMAPCQTEFNNPIIQKTSGSAVNSFARCVIEGNPQKAGKYQIKILFSIPGSYISASETIPLIVR